MLKKLHLTARTLIAAACCFAGVAHAQLVVDFSGAGANQYPIAIADFGGDGTNSSQIVTSVIRNNLERSGMFRLVDPYGFNLTETSPVDYGTWKNRQADYLVAGSLGKSADGRMEARFRLYDINRQTVLGGAAYLAASNQLRAAGHKISDYIYEKITNERGIFSTRIAYVVKSGNRYQLQVADADGHNPQTALVSPEPIISPAWAPTGDRIAYVSFESKKPIIYVHSLSTGKRQVIANFKGSNSAPAWAPDGQRLAIVLTKDGSSQVYLIGSTGTGLQRLTNSSGIDTEPQFSPDGAYVYFTSDRGGSPQIYRVSSTGGTPERVTFEGNYNVSPHISPDGKTLAFITRREGRFQLATMDLASRQMQVLSDSQKDESPSFAPNGRMILFATEIGGRGVLSAISPDGRIRQRLSVTSGDVREPAWGPFTK